MARTKAHPVERIRTIELDEVPPPDQADEEIEPDDFELANAASELSSINGASVTVYRQGVHGRDLTFIDTLPPGNFAMTMLKHPPYGGGKFRIIMRDARGVVRLNRLQAVEPAPVVALPASAVNALSGDAGIAILGKAMVEGFGRIGEAMAKLGEMVATQRSVPAVQAPGLRDLLGDVQALKDLIAPVGPASDPLAMVQSLLGIIKDLPGRGDDDSPRRGSASEMDVLLEAAKVLLPQIVNAAATAPPHAGGTIARPMIASAGFTPARPPLTVVPTQPAQNDPAVNPAAMLVNFLVDQAKRANDPQAYAVVVLDNVPPEIVQTWTTRADWFEEICKIAPDAAPFRGWFDKLRDEIVGYLTNEETQADNSGEATQGSPPDAAFAPGS